MTHGTGRFCPVTFGKVKNIYAKDVPFGSRKQTLSNCFTMFFLNPSDLSLNFGPNKKDFVNEFSGNGSVRATLRILSGVSMCVA